MKWKMATAKPTKITRAATTPRHGLEHYCRDLNGWPRSWMGLEKDLPPGEQLVTLFRPFLEHLAMSNLTPKTIQKHVDNIWVLGGEFITELNYTPSLRKAPVEKVLADMMLFVEGNGPLDQIGRVALWDGSIPQCFHKNHLIKFGAGRDVMPAYVLFQMMCPEGRSQLLPGQAAPAH